VSFKRLHRKRGQSEFAGNDFDSISAFESQAIPQQRQIPADRYTEPDTNYAEELSAVCNEYPKLGEALKTLNPYQLQAVFSKDKKVLLSAMVGSGKTTVLTHKVLYLHFVKRVALSDMAVLTFTNKAAREIKERILSFYEHATPPSPEDLRYFGTFHSIARQLLKEHPNLHTLGFTPSFSIMDQEAKADFLQRLIITHELDVKYPNKLDQRWKLYRNEKQILYGNMKHEDDLPKLIQISRKEKQENNLMDFDDLIAIANWLLGQEQSFLPEWIIVDEFQDCNEPQLQMIKHLSKKETNFFAVGDPNQSIYAWRGSSKKLFQKLIDDSACQIMKLPLNYRTSEQLLNAASHLLNDSEKDLEATRPQGKKLIIRNHYDDHQEAHYLVQKFKELQQSGLPLEDIAVLFRTRQQIAIFESVLQIENMPCQVVSKTSLREQSALFWLQKLLLAGLHINDFDSIVHIFTHADFGCIKAGKRLINSYNKFVSDKNFDSKLEAFLHFLETKHKKQTEHISLAKRLIYLRKYLANSNGDIDIYKYLSLDIFLKPTSVHYQHHYADIKEALDEITAYTRKNYFGNWPGIYQAAMSQVNLEGHFHINHGLQEKKEGVQLLTIHAAKGLEFDHVYLSGANTGIIPLERKKAGPDHLQEEKRLLFVALTRAKNHMEISWHTQSQAWNAQEGPSYFLNSIPSQLVERVETTKEEVDAEANVEAPSTTNEKWPVDSKVKHAKYGEGIILQCSDKDIVCDFGKYGEKSFAIAWAPLVKL
jgi:DNA helicase-2/ATP-dependent DNA helicase PcrA